MSAGRTVAIVSGAGPIAYPAEAPFRPEEPYPELHGRVQAGKQPNLTYALFRRLARNLQLDRDRIFTADWNPLGDIIRPGQRVVIKPNLVYHLHPEGGDYQAVVTHGSLVRCILDYVALALQGQGEIAVGDAPLQSADFDRIVEQTGLRQVCEDVGRAWQLPVRLVDFRLWSMATDDAKQVLSRGPRDGDMAGYQAINLDGQSMLAPWNGDCGRFRVTNYEPDKMAEHHNEKTHEYLIPRTILDADVVINLPKLKTHRKVGLTAALKNLVGINGHKDWLPHHRTGSVSEHGDEYRDPSFVKRVLTRLQEDIDRKPYSSMNRMRRLAMRVGWRVNRGMGTDPYYEGSWYGNDTLWRTVLDLNRLLIYADREGTMRQTPQRRSMTIVDGIIAGEGEGPLEPSARACGLLAAGINPLAVDAVLATVVGFDYRKLPLIARAFGLQDWPLADFGPADIEIRSDETKFVTLQVGEPFTEYGFTPPAGWRGHVELTLSSTRPSLGSSQWRR